MSDTAPTAAINPLAPEHLPYFIPAADGTDAMMHTAIYFLIFFAFLGGVFYSIDSLPEPWGLVSRFNPVLYMVNGLRFAMTGSADVPWWQGLAVLVVLNLLFGGIALRLLASGHKLRG